MSIRNKIKKSLGLSALVLLAGCCDEIGPVIDLGQGNQALLDTTYMESSVATAEDKGVLLEEFTGVACINCENGHIKAHELDSIYAGRVFSVALHSSFLDNPWPGSPSLQPRFDGANKADQISTTYASATAVVKPSAMIDRHDFSFSTTPEVTDLNQWKTAVDERLAVSSPCNVAVSSSWEADSNSSKIRVEVRYTAATTATHKLSIYLLEDDIVAEQLLPDNSHDSLYVHENVLRDVVTSITGASLDAALEPGRIFIKEFRYKIPTEWNPDHMRIIAFVHESGSENDVVQVAGTELK